MVWELVYTSAPRGLAEGSRGFCTVAATRGMPASLIPRIEALSGYRPAFGPEAPTDTVHPVQHTHVRLDHAGQTLSVLSRIVHAGHDYSGRTNKLAHHLVLEPHEQHAYLHANPAGWMRQFDGWLDRWSDEPQTLDPRKLRPVESSAGAPCHAWARVAGDAGYAGLLAERFLLDPSQPTYLHHDPLKHDALALLDEVNTLLPNESRWHATFATYFTDPLPESGATWRFVVAGTPAARQLGLATAASNLLDLLRPLPKLASTRYIDLARGIVNVGADPSTSRAESFAGFEQTPLRTPDIAVETPATTTVRPADKVAHTPQAPPSPHASETSMSPHRVPTAWFWPALAGWPIALVALAWAAWPTANESPTPPTLIAVPQAVPSTRALSDTKAQENLQSLHEELRAARSHSDQLAAQLAARFANAPEPKADQPQLPSGTIESIAKPADRMPPQALYARTFDEPVTPPILEAATTDRGHGWPAWVSSALPAPALQSSGAAGMGSLAILQATTSCLLQTSATRVADAIHLRPAALETSAALNLTWRADPSGYALHLVHADALGGSRSVEIGRAEWSSRDNTGDGLTWRWLPAQLDRPQAEALEAIGAEASLSVWQLRDAQGRTLSSVQGFEPIRLEVQIGEPSSEFLHRTPAKAAAVAELHMTFEAPSETWFREATAVSDRLVLRGPGEATLELALDEAPRTGVVLTTAWQPAEAELQRELETLRKSVAADRAWLDSWTHIEEERRRLVASLPRNAQGDIDDARRTDPAWLDSFARLDALADERGRLLDLHAADPDERRAVLTQRERQLTQCLAAVEAMANFPGCRVTVSLASSGARLAEVAVRR